VDDPLVRRAEPVERDPELPAVLLQLLDLGRRHRVEDRQAARVRRDGVVGRRDRLLRVTDSQPTRAKSREGLGTRHLVNEVEIDRQDARSSGVLDDDMVVPDLLDEGAGSGHGNSW
jgi:hypothetical protein